MLRHLLGCLIPIMLLFLLPVFGVSEGVTFFVFMVLMFVCHLSMMGGHGHHGDDDESEKGGSHGCH